MRSTTGQRKRRHAAALSTLGLVLGLLTGPIGLAAADPAAAGISAAGAVWAWGLGDTGQLGVGEPTAPTEARPPAAVPGMAAVVAVAAGDDHSLALAADGRVWAWGRGTEGQLGDGAATTRHRPVPVAGLSDVVGIAAGSRHSVALHGDGTVSAWGANGDGRLGDGTTTDRPAPIAVRSLTGVVRVAAAGSTTLALDGQGRVWELGWVTLDPSVPPPPPQRVDGLSDVRAVALSSGHRLALLADGTLRSWGANGSGQLGDGTRTGRQQPAPVPGATGVVAVAAGAAHSAALLADGSVLAWGDNSRGQLGSSALPGVVTRPTPVPGVASATALSAAWHHTLAVVGAGEVVGWGSNGTGQLGSPSAPIQWTPAPVPGITDARSLATSRAHTLATRLSAPTVPGTPAHVKATPAAGKAVVTWTAVPDGGAPITGWVVTATPGGAVVEVPADATSAEVIGLADGRAHRFTVAARNAVGTGAPSPPSAAVVHAVPPGAPLALTAEHGCPFICDVPWRPEGPTVTVSWRPPAHDGGTPVTGYVVTLTTPGAIRTVELDAVTTWQATGLTYGEPLAVTVAARTAAGTGPVAAPAHVTPLSVPAAPGAVTAVAGTGSAVVRWTPPVSDGGSSITRYTVVGSDGSTVTVGGAATSATVPGLTPGQPRTFRVRASNAVGAGRLSAASSAVTPRPAPVTGLTVGAAVGADGSGAPQLAAELTWTTPAGVDAVRLRWTDGTTAKSVTLPATTRHRVTGLAAGRSAAFTVTTLAGGTAGAARTATLDGSVVTASASASSVTVGTAVTLRGTLRAVSSTSPLAGRPVQLQTRTRRTDGSWTAWANSGAPTTTSATGGYARTISPARTTRYRVVYLGAPTVLGAVSPVRTVAVAPAVRASLSTTTVKPGATVALRGSVRPAAAARQVTLQRRSGDRWLDVAAARVGEAGAYRFSIVAPRGTTSYRVRVAATPAWAAGLSPVRTLTAR